MYIRWKTKPRTKLTHRRKREVHATLYSAYLVECKRVEGKPRQTTQYIASIQDKQMKFVSHRARFWSIARVKLQCAPPEQRETLEAALAKRVPLPTEEEIRQDQTDREARMRALRKAFGKE